MGFKSNVLIGDLSWTLWRGIGSHGDGMNRFLQMSHERLGSDSYSCRQIAEISGRKIHNYLSGEIYAHLTDFKSESLEWFARSELELSVVTVLVAFTVERC